jgi:ABC-type dipeptide/oligopeptide/nickel transport system ATPase component
MSKNICCVKGVSGSGKSTRVFLLIKFLEHCGFVTEDFKFINFENKEKVVGILFPDLDIVFIGKKYITGSFERFQGYDVMTGYFGKSALFSDFLKENSSKYHFVVEGAGVTGTNRLRPLFLHDFCGFENIMIQYYNYELDQKDEYQARIIYRSGKLPNKGTMWDKCSGFISDHRDSLKEITGLKQVLGEDINMYSFYNPYNTPEYDFGMKMLTFMNMEDFIPAFSNFCRKSNYLIENSFNNFNDGSKG